MASFLERCQWIFFLSMDVMLLVLTKFPITKRTYTLLNLFPSSLCSSVCEWADFAGVFQCRPYKCGECSLLDLPTAMAKVAGQVRPGVVSLLSDGFNMGIWSSDESRGELLYTLQRKLHVECAHGWYTKKLRVDVCW